jgi:hypothetical protein
MLGRYSRLIRLSFDQPANSGMSFPPRFLHEEFPEVSPGAGILPLACSAACPGFLARGWSPGWPSGPWCAVKDGAREVEVQRGRSSKPEKGNG